MFVCKVYLRFSLPRSALQARKLRRGVQDAVEAIARVSRRKEEEALYNEIFGEERQEEAAAREARRRQVEQMDTLMEQQGWISFGSSLQ